MFPFQRVLLWVFPLVCCGDVSEMPFVLGKVCVHQDHTTELMWVFEVSATSGLGVDLSPVSDKGFQGSCTAALPAQWFPLLLLLLLTLCSLNTHFLLGERWRWFCVFLIIVEMLENSAVSVGLWHFSTRVKSSYGPGHHPVLWHSLFKNLYLLQDHFVE